MERSTCRVFVVDDLASTPNPSSLGKLVAFTATVTSATTTPTGTVTFFDGSSALGTVNVAAGKAVYRTAALTKGQHSVTAVYNGVASVAASASNLVTQTVN